MIICGTGHRPNRLGRPGLSGYDPRVTDAMLGAIDAALTERGVTPTHVISGMALGFDLALARYAVAHGIPWTAAIPFAGQERLWPEDSQRLWRDLCALASHVQIVSPGGYSPAKMQARNRWMVDRADQVLALWDGTAGGTANAVSYARLRNKPVINAYDHFTRLRP